MTLFVLEGPSASGKSTIRDELTDNNPQYVRWKGENLMRKGVGDNWVEYRERYHEALHRLYELNPDNVILADRGFSDCVYNSDEKTRQEFRRLAACYGDVHILYFYPGELNENEIADIQVADIALRSLGEVNERFHDMSGRDELRERGSRDLPKLEQILSGYEKLLQMFPYTHIDTGKLTVERSTRAAENTIKQVHNENVHNPDL